MGIFVGLVLMFLVAMLCFRGYLRFSEERFFRENNQEFLSIRNTIFIHKNDQGQSTRNSMRLLDTNPVLQKRGFQRVFPSDGCIVFQKTIGAMSTNFEIWNCPSPVLDEDRTMIKKLDNEWYLVEYSQ